jgi:hypothetical protein
MDIILDIVRSATQGEATLTRALMIALLLLLLPTLYFFMARARAQRRAGKPFGLRPIAAIESLTRAMEQAAETGQPVHITLGSGGIGDASTAESTAALLLLDHLAQRAASYNAQPIVTTADPTLMLAAQDTLRRAYMQRGFLAGYAPSKVRMVAPERVAYAAGVMDLIGHERLSGNVLAGSFGDEYLLMGEVGARRGLEQVAGATDPNVLPFVYATTNRPLLGEELFAAPAYLDQKPAHVGSLFAQDWMRGLLILLIIAGAIAKSLL